MTIALLLFLRIAISVVSTVAPETLAAFAQHESGLNPLAIHDNTLRRSYFPNTVTDATALANALLARGHSLDLGIMQVNTANLTSTGLSVATAFDPMESVRAGAMMLTAAYRQCLRGNLHADPAEQQLALRCAASVYNTGDKQVGILNGYQSRVWQTAAQIVPAIETARAGGIEPLQSPATVDDVKTPQPRRPGTGLEDVLHLGRPAPAVSDGLTDSLHLPDQKDAL